MTFILLVVVAFVSSVVASFMVMKWHKAGTIEVGVNDEGIKVFTLEIDYDPDEIELRSYLVFKVKKVKVNNDNWP